MERCCRTRRCGVPTASSLQQCGGSLGIRTPPWPSGTAVWPSAAGRSASESASQRLSEGLPNLRVYSRAPPKIRKVPVNGVSQRRRPRPVCRTGVRLDCNRACPRAVGGLLFRADFRGLPQGHRSSSRQQRQMSTVAPAISVFEPPSRPSDADAWPSASRSASPSASQRPPEGLPNPRVYSRVPPKIGRVPVNAVSLCRSLSHRLPGTATRPPRRFRPQRRYRSLLPFQRTATLIQKSHPATLLSQDRTTPPVAFYFRNGWLFSPEYAFGPSTQGPSPS